MAKRPTRREGFDGQRMRVVPRPMLNETSFPIGSMLTVTDVGFFPKASQHEVRRRGGRAELILMYCTRGQGWVECSNQRQTVAAGDLVALPPRQPHAYGASPQDPWSIYWVHLQGRGIDELRLTPTPSGACTLRLGNRPGIASRFHELLETYEHGISECELILASGLACALCAEILVASKRADAGQGPAAKRRVSEVIRLIHTRFQQPVSVPALARLSGLSTPHFAALFRTLTGFPPHRYVLRLRLARAMELAGSSDLSFKQIASEVGFHSQLYFSRQFRRVYGISPTEARATHRAEAPVVPL